MKQFIKTQDGRYVRAEVFVRFGVACRVIGDNAAYRVYGATELQNSPTDTEKFWIADFEVKASAQAYLDALIDKLEGNETVDYEPTF